jgi:hypothetical protein
LDNPPCDLHFLAREIAEHGIMSEASTEQLLAEIRYLRGLVLSLSATLLRKVALGQYDIRHSDSSADAERLLREAEECFRCAKLPGLKSPIADGLQAAGHEFMERAVAIESQLQRQTKSGK